MGRLKRIGDPRVAIGYARVSTSDQELSPDVQREAIASFCEAQDASVAAHHCDTGVSGGAPLERRQGLLQALSDLKEHGAGILVVAKWDRLARSAEKAAVIERIVSESGAKIVSADGVANEDTPEGRLLRTLLAGFSEYERDLIRMRTRVALARLRSTDKRWTCHAPYGYRWEEGVLCAEPDEIEVVTFIITATSRGDSRRQVLSQLQEQYPERCRGDSWHLTTVQRIVGRKA